MHATDSEACGGGVGGCRGTSHHMGPRGTWRWECVACLLAHSVEIARRQLKNKTTIGRHNIRKREDKKTAAFCTRNSINLLWDAGSAEAEAEAEAQLSRNGILCGTICRRAPPIRHRHSLPSRCVLENKDTQKKKETRLEENRPPEVGCKR